MSDQVDFLHAEKHESYLQINTMILIGMISIPKVAKVASLQFFYNISKKKLVTKLIFCMQITAKFPTSWFQHFGYLSFLQRDTIIIDGHDQVFSKYSK